MPDTVVMNNFMPISHPQLFSTKENTRSTEPLPIRSGWKYYVISEDDTFIFAYNIIALGANKYGDYHRIMTCNLKEENLNTIPGIEQVCKEYKEDYPKTSLADYLLDDDNREVFNSKRCDLQKDEDWWLCAFNKAYEISDLIRVKAGYDIADYIVQQLKANKTYDQQQNRNQISSVKYQ
ncbi:hypothetical protein [uncultured Proteiniphilum sp.]|uniref:hypothetical protein n=1 Tax=uncultured Proteiniphilum sp. TaxID=497637 RepID=UPI00261736BB|nr:hypothetical protein [uncultured Proteiniphilum sp.]